MASSDDTSACCGHDAALSSEERVHTSPPSSPPPKSRPDAFSVLGKRKALAPVANNTVTKKAKPTLSSSSSSSTPSLTQLQISLGQTVQKKCLDCGMSYITSSTEDRRLHDKFHKQTTQGYDVGKNFVSTLSKQSDQIKSPLFRPRPPVRHISLDDAICRISPTFATVHQRKRAKDVLKIVQQLLGAVEIPERLLDRTEPDRYVSYLYVRGTKCIGYLLAEDIVRAYTVVEPRRPGSRDSGGGGSGTGTGAATTGSSALAALKARQQAVEDEATQPLRLSEETTRAVLGVSRIWTSPDHRGQKIAQAMLGEALVDAVRSVNARLRHVQARNEGVQRGDGALHAYGQVKKGWTRDHILAAIEAQRTGEVKSMIAFSQPTVAGTRLARKWFGKRYGWLVYVD